jgi:GT2 family glycosyltransferase
MYGEDINLSYRVIKAGYKNYYVADTTIIHYKGESTKKGTLNYVKVFYQAMIIFARKHFATSRAGLFSFLIQYGRHISRFGHCRIEPSVLVLSHGRRCPDRALGAFTTSFISGLAISKMPRAITRWLLLAW